jgi:TPR repeat protein
MLGAGGAAGFGRGGGGNSGALRSGDARDRGRSDLAGGAEEAVFTSGTGVGADASKAASFLDRACRGGDAEGCNDLGVAYEKGTGVTPDRRRAAELFRKACQLGFQQACVRKAR